MASLCYIVIVVFSHFIIVVVSSKSWVLSVQFKVKNLIFLLMKFKSSFQMVPEIIIVVPPLLGLKGNLEMTLAAR